MAVTKFYFQRKTGVAITDYLSLAAAKKQLRLENDFNDDDAHITDDIEAALLYCENYLGAKLFQGETVFECDSFSSPFIFKTSSNDDLISKVEYIAFGDTGYTELDAEKYILRNASSIGAKEIKFLEMPATAESAAAVKIYVSQGYEPSKLPKDIQKAIKVLITTYYEVRENRGEIGYNQAVHDALRAYKNY